MELISGLGKKDRSRLSAILRETKGTISVSDAAGILGVPAVEAAKMLSRWAQKGWLSRVRRSLYIPIPIESRTADIPLEDPWIIADRLFSPCYIGGWSAAEHWELTEQLFRTVIIITVRKPRNRNPVIKNTSFMLRTISEKTFFGTRQVWREQVKVSVSDPSRTIIDMLNTPKLGGGIRIVSDMFLNYLKSKHKNLNILISYAKLMGNGAVIKRLGFLLERLMPNETAVINECMATLTKGNVKLDPALKCERLITRWKLWIPESWTLENRL